MESRILLFESEIYKKWLKSYSDKGCKEKVLRKKEGFYFIMTNNGIVD